MWGYQRRLYRDLARWRAAGWVTPEGEERIRAELGPMRRGFGLSGALAVLGAVLLGFAAMSFVAANWQDMSKLARLVVLGGALVASYGGAGVLFDRKLDGFAHAALLLGVAIFGAAIMLVAQMYHMDGNPPDAVLTWAAGALGTGALVGSNPALAAAVLLTGLWSGWETVIAGGVHWWFLPAMALIIAAMVRQGWRPGLKLAGLALAVWVVALGYLVNNGHAHPIVVLIGLVIIGGVFAARHLGVGLPFDETSLIALGMGIAFAGMFAQQFIEPVSTPSLIVLAMLTLAALLAAIYWGAQTGYGGVMWIGYAGFSVEVLGIYFKTIGTLMGSSLFFLLTGLLVIALAALAWRLHERNGDTEVVQ